MEDDSRRTFMLAGPGMLGVYVGGGCSTRRAENVRVDAGGKTLSSCVQV